MGRSHSRSYGQWPTFIRQNLGLRQILCTNVIKLSGPGGRGRVSNGLGFGFCSPGDVFIWKGLTVVNVPDKVLGI